MVILNLTRRLRLTQIQDRSHPGRRRRASVRGGVHIGRRRSSSASVRGGVHIVDLHD
jgi:hypothetical protein